MTALRTGAPAGTWTLDVSASTARFRARGLLGTTVVGTLDVLSASVQVSADGRPERVDAELDLASVATGSARRDADLRGPRFFDAQRGPALLVSAVRPQHVIAAQPAGSARWLLTGELAMKGRRCPVDITAELLHLEDGQAHVHATAVIDRRDVGIMVPRLLVGRTVAIEVDGVLRAPRAAHA